MARGGYKYDYRCPACGTQLQFRMRVTQTRRRCPHCGEPVRTAEIDRQASEQVMAQVWGCLGCLGLLGLAVVCGGCLSKTKPAVAPDPALPAKQSPAEKRAGVGVRGR